MPTARRKSPNTDQTEFFVPEDMTEFPQSDWRPPDVSTLPDRLYGVVGLDLETRDLGLQANQGPGWAWGGGYPVGYSITADNGSWYLPLRHEGGDNVEVEPALKWLRHVLGRTDQTTVFANAMYDIGWAARDSVMLPGTIVDVQWVEALLDEYQLSYSLDSIARRRLGYGKEEDLLDGATRAYGGKGKGDLWKLPARYVGPYAVVDSQLPRAIWAQQREEVEAQDLRGIVQLEHDLLPMYLDMRRRGIRIDVDYAERLQKELEDKNEALARRLHRDYGYSGGAWSKAKIVQVLQSEGIHSIYGTCDAAFLQSCNHTFAAGILEWRQQDKLLGTFVKSQILGNLHGHRVHGEIRPLASDDGGTVCVVAETLFNTNRGVLPYSELRVGDQVISHRGEPRAIVDLIDNGVAPVFRVTLDNGMSLDCTANHPILTPTGWVKTGELAAGQRVIVKGSRERWAQVEGWPGFTVSSWGRVRGITGNVRKQQPKGKWGHLKVTLARNGAQRRGPDVRDFPVHRLVASVFSPNPDQLPQTRHLNGIAWDNTIENLTWGTNADNKNDMRLHGTGKGAHEDQAKLDWDTILLIRSLPLARRNGAGGPTNEELSLRFGVCERLIRGIRNGQRWVQPEPFDYTAQFSEASVASVEYVGSLPTYGVAVDQDHSHVTNGIVSHNTGRISMSAPNLQNIPVRSDIGKLLRGLFLPEQGEYWSSCDYSQQEVRLMVHFAVLAKCQGAEEAKHSYETDPDLNYHKFTAELTGLDYKSAKNLNFAILYGRGIIATARELGLSEEATREKFEQHAQKMPFARALSRLCMRRVAKRGYLRTLGGRHCRFPYWEPSDWQKRTKGFFLREQAETKWPRDHLTRARIHKSLNSLIQPSAADQMKMAMRAIWQAGLGHHVLVQVHDELGVSVPDKQTADTIAGLMRDAVPLEVPVAVDATLGANWREAKA